LCVNELTKTFHRMCSTCRNAGYLKTTVIDMAKQYILPLRITYKLIEELCL
jgi:hypothetical protein